jgi:predicted nucleic acid-binding protein
LEQDEAQGLVCDFLSLDIPTPLPVGMYRRAYELAERYGRSTIYDTCYLALADLLSCDLLTLDRPLYNVACGDFPLLKLMG